MHAEDMILVSVDDHIAEPADMFEGHYRPSTGTSPHVYRRTSTVFSNGGTAKKGAESGS